MCYETPEGDRFTLSSAFRHKKPHLIVSLIQVILLPFLQRTISLSFFFSSFFIVDLPSDCEHMIM